MISSRASMLPTWLLSLTLILPQISSTALHEKAKLFVRQAAPAVPDANDPAFQTIILNNVNTFRDYQDAMSLTYCDELANYSAGLANRCNIDTETESQYGEIVTGGSPSTYERDSWDNFSLADAANELIRGWYDANASYIADPTFTLLPFGRSYTQLVWKASTRIGCAWTPASCKFDVASAFYLRCAFSPKGNIDGHFEGNVSCNGCSHGAESPSPSELAPLQERQVQLAESAFGNLLLVVINKIRADARVPLVSWNEPYRLLAETLAQKCRGKPQVGEAIGKAIHGPIPYIPTWDATRETVNAWASQPGSAAFATITGPTQTRFGCGWNKNVCPDDNWYLHCFFGRWDTGILSAPHTERTISARQAGLLDVDLDKMNDILVDDLLPGINTLRKESGQPPVAWCEGLRNDARDRGAGCFEHAAFGDYQVLLNYKWPLPLNPSFELMSLTAPQSWNKTKPEHETWDPNYYMPDYVKITQPEWKSVGCYWSRNCTAENNYLLYCEFSRFKLYTRGNDIAVAPRQEIDNRLQIDLGNAMIRMRQEAGLESSGLVWSGQMATQSQTDADRCSGAKDNPLYAQARYQYDDARGVRSKQQKNVLALVDWINQRTPPDPLAKSDYNAIVDPKNKQYGCAWSTKCGVVHFLYCSFYHG